MTIHVYTIVWNNEFMLPHFLRHYEKFADKIFVIDDHSTDKTAEIAKAHPKVEYSVYEHEGWNEQEVNDTFYKFYKNNPSDWAVVADSDEFISLMRIGQLSSGVYKTQTYLMFGVSNNLHDCIEIRWRSLDKPVVFDPKLDVKFGPGRHSCNLPTQVGPIMYHYKYPSREYYIERNKVAYLRFMDEALADKMLKRGLACYDNHVA